MVFGSMMNALLIFTQIRLYYPESTLKGMIFCKNSSRSISKVILYFILKILRIKEDIPCQEGFEKIVSR